jgi:hypothetical protein
MLTTRQPVPEASMLTTRPPVPEASMLTTRPPVPEASMLTTMQVLKLRKNTCFYILRAMMLKNGIGNQ